MSEFKTKNKSKWKFHAKFWFSYRRDRKYPSLEYSINLIPSINIWYDSDFFHIDDYHESPNITIGWLFWSVCLWFEKNAKSEIENK